MAKLLSNKIKKVPSDQADPNRYEFISLENTEPDLGVPSTNNQVLVSDIDGTRQWSSNVSIETIELDSLVVNSFTELNGNTTINGTITVNGVNTQSIGTQTELIEEFFGETITTENLSVANDAAFDANVIFTNGVTFNGNVLFDTETLLITGNNVQISSDVLYDGTATFTNQVTANDVAVGALIVSTPIDGQVDDISNHNTDDLVEGNTNLYYTDERVRDAVSANGDLSYDANTGEFSVTTYKSADFDSDLATKTTNDLSEGNTNLYYTDQRAIDAIEAATKINLNDLSVANIDYPTVDGLNGQVITTNGTGNLSFEDPIANGGLTDQLLVKSSNADFDTEWTSVPTVKGLQLDTADPADDATGRIIWNDGDGVPQFISNGTKVNLGLELLARCRNVTGNTIPKGTAVCIVGASANRISIAPSDRATPGSACRTIGLTIEEIPTNEFGKVSTFGLVRGLNTNAFDEGDELYVGETPGSLTTVEPTSPARRLTVGYVVTKNTSTGQIFVTLRRGVRVNEIDDVEITSLTDNDILRYSNANSRWENQELTTDLVDEGNTNLYFTNQRVLNYVESDLSTDNLSEGNTNLYYTNERVRDAVSANGDLNYDANTGEFSVTTYKSSDFDSDFTGKTTDNLSEGNTNLYFIEAPNDGEQYARKNQSWQIVDIPPGYSSTDFDNDLTTKTTDDLAEGNTNLYFTTARIDDHITTANGIVYSGGLISATQSINTTANVTFDNITLTGTVTLGKDPASANSAATKRYVDEVASGLQARSAAQVLVDENIDVILDPDGFETGWSTITANTDGAFPTTDGVSSVDLNVVSTRFLFIAQDNEEENGLYVLITPGTESTPWVLRRCKDCKTDAQVPGSFVFVELGDTYKSTGWVATVENPSTFQVDVDPIVWVQFSGAGTFVAGTGLTLDGNEFSVNANLSHVTTVGTLVGGTWQANVIGSEYGGTGVNNGGRTLTISTANVSLNAASSGSTLNLPATGTLATTANIASIIEKKSVVVANTDITTIDTVNKNNIRAVKYIINVDQGSEFRTSEILVSHNKDANSSLTEYAIVSSDIEIGSFSTDISGDNVRLRVTMGSATSANVQFTRILL